MSSADNNNMSNSNNNNNNIRQQHQNADETSTTTSTRKRKTREKNNVRDPLDNRFYSFLGNAAHSTAGVKIASKNMTSSSSHPSLTLLHGDATSLPQASSPSSSSPAMSPTMLGAEMQTTKPCGNTGFASHWRIAPTTSSQKNSKKRSLSPQQSSRKRQKVATGQINGQPNQTKPTTPIASTAWMISPHHRQITQEQHAVRPVADVSCPSESVLGHVMPTSTFSTMHYSHGYGGFGEGLVCTRNNFLLMDSQPCSQPTDHPATPNTSSNEASSSVKTPLHQHKVHHSESHASSSYESEHYVTREHVHTTSSSSSSSSAAYSTTSPHSIQQDQSSQQQQLPEQQERLYEMMYRELTNSSQAQQQSDQNRQPRVRALSIKELLN